MPLHDSSNYEGFDGGTKQRNRPVFVLPLMVNLAIIASIPTICGHIEGQEYYDEAQFPLAHFVFLESAVLFAPMMIALSKLFPDPCYALCTGSVISIVGLLWTYTVNGCLQMFVFGVVVGIGVSLSFTTSSIYVAPYFVHENRLPGVFILVSATVSMFSGQHAVNKLLSELGNYTFFTLCPPLIITSIVALIDKLYRDKKRKPVERGCAMNLDSLINNNSRYEEESIEKYHDGYHLIKREDLEGKNFESVSLKEGWCLSIISVFVWLLWGAGVDSSWLALMWNSTFYTTESITVLQLLLSLVVLLIKMLTEPNIPVTQPQTHTPEFTALSSNTKSTPSDNEKAKNNELQARMLQKHSNYNVANDRVVPKPEGLVFSCSYMFLGLLGIGGLQTVFFPNHVVPLYNNIVFSLCFALQFDDLSDLPNSYDLSTQQDTRVVRGVTLRKSAINNLDLRMNKQDICCLICHLLSLLLMSCLTLLLGLQISNAMLYILNMPFFALSSSPCGVVMISVLSLLLCLIRPHSFTYRRSRIHRIFQFQE